MAAFAVLTLSIRAVVEHETFKWNNLACNPLKDSSAGPAGFTREMVFSHVASCDASSTLYPLCQPTFDAALVFSLGQVADAAVKESGLDLGTPAADSIIAWRTEDGWSANCGRPLPPMYHLWSRRPAPTMQSLSTDTIGRLPQRQSPALLMMTPMSGSHELSRSERNESAEEQ
jgi:hypothetical protein